MSQRWRVARIRRAGPLDFPLVQQDGLKALGYIWDPSKSATCTGTLTYREDGGRTTILALDRTGFTTAAS